eukprot:g129.t1
MPDSGSPRNIQGLSWSDRPSLQPVNVGLSILIKDLSAVDMATSSFSCNIGMKVTWNDWRLRNCDPSAVGFHLPKNLWVPHIMMPDAAAMEDGDFLERGSTHSTSSGVRVANAAAGQLIYQRNVRARFTCPFDLKAFPFDEHHLKIRFNGSKLRDGRPATAGDQVIHAGVKPELVEGQARALPFLLFSDNLPTLIPEYNIVGAAYHQYVKNDCSFLVWGVYIRRGYTHYFFHYCITLYITSCLALMTLFFPAAAFMVRMECLVGLFTAGIMFQFVLKGEMPKTPYMHKMDQLIILNLVFIFLIAVWGLFEYMMINNEDIERWYGGGGGSTASGNSSTTSTSAGTRTSMVELIDHAVGVMGLGELRPPAVTTDADTDSDGHDASSSTATAFCHPNFCLARYLFMAILSFLWIAVQARLFFIPIVRRCFRKEGARPEALSPAKTFVPDRSIVKIDLWAE